MSLPEEYRKLIELGINRSANLSDLNDMTDRGPFPMKPWTASKTCGTIALIKKYNITDEETFLKYFQSESKIPIEELTNQVYNHQLKYFGFHKYEINVIFKYTYCCIVINSLMGNSNERKFDKWAIINSIKTIQPHHLLDEKFHTDRLQIDNNGKVIGFISIKPNSFYSNFLQYQDVFAGLQVITNLTGIKWKIYYMNGDSFKLMDMTTLNQEQQNIILNLTVKYNENEIFEISQILNTLQYNLLLT
jgi:hypothetical protein